MNLLGLKTLKMKCNNIYDISVGLFRGFVSPIIFMFGLLGNILTIWVFLNKNFINRFATYVICSSISHCVILLLNTFLDDFLGRGLSYVLQGSCDSFFVKVDGLSIFSCKAMQYVTEVMYVTSSWVMVAFSVDRVVTIYNPMRFYANYHVCVSTTICAIILVAGVILSIPFAISSVIIVNTSNDNKSFLKCDLQPNVTYVTSRVGLYSKVFISFAIPAFVVLLTNVFIVWKLLAIKRRREALLPFDHTRSALEMSRVVGHLAISFFFLLMTTPLMVTMMIRLYFTGRNRLGDALILHNLGDLTRLFSSLKDINYASEFYVYLACLPTFRRTLIENLRHLRRHPRLSKRFAVMETISSSLAAKKVSFGK